MSISKIEWTDRTWNPVTGCTKVSQGCKHCYAERMYERFHGHGSFKNVICHENRLTQPLHWKKAAMVFVNSMSDLFHEDVPFEFIDAVFRVMKDVNKHTYQVLTKRPQRMLEFVKWKNEQLNIQWGWMPSSNVWLGVSVENQKAADERIPLLLQIRADVRFLSCEPLIGPVLLFNSTTNYCKELNFCHKCGWMGAFDNKREEHDGCGSSAYAVRGKIDWVICGGESGPGARPMHPQWATSLKAQCKYFEVPFFFKQWGEYYTNHQTMDTHEPVFKMYNSYEHFAAKDWVNTGDRCISIDGTECKIGDDFMKCAYPVAIMNRVGKTKAGRLLDGREYSEFPK